MTDSTRQFAEGEPCWAEVTLPDAEVGKRFYGALLGWTFEPARSMEDDGGPLHGTDGGRLPHAADEGGHLAALHGRPVAAVREWSGHGLRAVWRLHLSTADAAAALTRVRDAGGRVVADAVEVPGGGVTAVAADPGGADFGLWEPRGGRTGFVAADEPGAYVWGEVLAREEDREAVDTFYERVFGFGTYPADFGAGSPAEGTDFAVWVPSGAPAGDARAIGGRGTLDVAAFPEAAPHFLTYFSVADCAGTAHTAVRLGGRVHSGPMDTAYGCHAVLADDQGAEFAVMTRS
ncbi:VOC family protein [Streptomyces iconiensis]|uniref:VOC family protein n=1 Tax=Streptomyces iconiensis TaxID=1384038 RepID=A0ABT6ZYE7_9ACTN|nr:VOC family protein [Streptomyces iconiensis]MDJ1134093.1 VOC family protein [Streptomyces iconiensis]